MNINIYYGGRGIIDDPTLFVINKMQEILEELRVNVTRYNLYESKNAIPTLPQTLKEADGIILATTVEWYGIGGYMQQFLDACWLFGDKEKIAKAAQGAGTFPGGAGRPDLRHRPYRPAHPDLQEKAPQRRVIVHRIKIRLSNESRIFMRKIPPITNRALQLIRRG